jgi:surface protein
MSNPRYGSGRNQFIGQGVDVDLTKLDAAAYEGAVVYSENQIYFSDGSGWTIPQDTVDIARPRGVPPLTIEQQAQLTLSPFASPTGETQIGIIYEWNADGIADFSVGANVETRTVTSTTTNIYDILYPEDGFEPGDVIWWRAKYLGTNGTQSQYSTPIAQFYPPLLSDPEPVTRVGAITGEVEITPFFSLFGLQYVQTEFQFWNEGDDPEVDPPLLEVTSQLGAALTLPEELAEGGNYLWRARYGANLTGVGSPTAFTNYTVARVVNKGAGSMVLVYDPALANSRTITLPLGIYGGVVNVTVDWGDGNEETFTTSGYKNHTYAAGVTGLVTVVISGQLEQYGGNTNIQGLVRVDNIGFNLGLTSLREMFRNCTQNTTVVTPNLPPQVTDAQGMFYNADPGFDPASLDTSNIQDMSEMFYLSPQTQSNLAGLDTSSATNMYRMFRQYAGTNPDMTGYVTANVTSIKEMFYVSSVVTGIGIETWDTSGVTDMSFSFRSMFGFSNASGFANWDVSNVVTFREMFLSTPGNYDVANWDVSNCVDFHRMFQSASQFNRDISGWNVSNGQDFSFMFVNAVSFNSPITGWDLSSATSVNAMFSGTAMNSDVTGVQLPPNISSMFQQAYAFNHPSINSWDVSGVTNMSALFRSAREFNQPLNNWDVSGVTDMSDMFHADSIGNKFNQNINNWDVSNVTNMARMFAQDSRASFGQPNAFNQPLDNWDVSSVQDMSQMFAVIGSTTTGLLNIQFDQDISSWNLRAAGVSLQDFMTGGAGQTSFSTENYSKLLAGWANNTTGNNGPFNVSAGFGDRTYNDTDYFVGELYEDAVEGRAYLTNSNRLTVSSAGDPLADGDYLYSAVTQLYENTNDWYFIKTGGVWELRDNLDVVQATQQDVGDLDAPQLVTTWDGDLASATVLRTGAAWTIVDGGQVV